MSTEPKLVKILYYDIREVSDEPTSKTDGFGYILMEESGYLIDRRIINGIDSIILRTETDWSRLNTDEEQSSFLIVPVSCVHKIVETNNFQEIDLGGKAL